MVLFTEYLYDINMQNYKKKINVVSNILDGGNKT